MPTVHRRTLLRAGPAAGSSGLSACTDEQPDADRFVAPDGPKVGAAERARDPGAVRELRLTAGVGPVDSADRP